MSWYFGGKEEEEWNNDTDIVIFDIDKLNKSLNITEKQSEVMWSR